MFLVPRGVAVELCILLVACTKGGSRIMVWGGAGGHYRGGGGSRWYRDELMTVCNMAPGWQGDI